MSAPLFEGLFVSVSQIRCYQTCPMKYRLRYVEGVEPAFVPVALAFGTAFHRALGFCYSAVAETGNVPALDDVVGVLREAWAITATGQVPLQADEEEKFDPLEMGSAMLRVFHEHVATGPPPVVESVEGSFAVDLHDPETGEILEEKLVGVWDLVLHEDDHSVIVEHKSASRKYAADQLRYDLQPTAYQFAARQLGLGEVGLRYQVVTKTRTPTIQVEDLRRDEQDELDFLRTAVGVLRAVEAKAFWPNRGWQCRSCPYTGPCARTARGGAS